MRNVNYRLLAWLIVGTGVVCGGVWALRQFQVSRKAGVFLQMAEREAQASRFERAMRDYSIYLGLVPNDAEAMGQYGKLLAQMGKIGHAFDTLERSVQLAPDNSDARRQLVELLIGMNRHRDAREHLESYLLKETPEDGHLHAMLGQCQEALDQPKAAAASYCTAIRWAPQSLDAYASLARLLRRQGDAATGDRWIGQLTAANPQSARAYVLRGRYWHDAGKLAEATQDAEHALQLSADDADALVFAAQCALAREDFATARAHADRGVRQHPARPEFYSVMANLESCQGHRDAAIVWLRRGVLAVPANAELQGNLANLLLDEQQLSEAAQVLRRLEDSPNAPQLVGYLKARLAYQQEQWLEASNLLEQVRPELVTSPALLKQVDYWLGNCYAQLGKADLQLTACRRAVAADPLWIRARIGLIAALASLNQTGEALEEARATMKLRGAPPEVWLQVARLAILRNLGEAHGERKWEEVEAALAEAARALPNSAQVPILRAEALVGQDRLADAEKTLDDARKRAPMELELWIASASLAQRRQDWAAAERLLSEAAQQLGDRAALRLARAQVLVRRDGKQAAKVLAECARPTNSGSAAEARQLQWGLTMLAMEIGDVALARQLTARLAETEPNNLQLRLLQFDLALRAEDGEEMERVIAHIQRIEGEGPLWHYGRAVCLRAASKSGNAKLLDEALNHLNQVRTLRPAWSRIPLLAGEIHDQQRHEKAAVQDYLRAIELGQRDPVAIRRTVQLLAQQQRYAEADRVIRRLEEQQTPFTADLGRMAAEVSMRLDEFDRALDKARQVATSSQDYRDHVWLGQLLGLLAARAKTDKREADEQKMLQQADKEFQEAIRLSQSAPDAWVAFIQFLARTGQTPRAEAAIAEAAAKIPPAAAPLALAECCEAIGQSAEAEKKYQAALAAAPNNPAILRAVADFFLRSGKSRRAESELNRLIDGRLQADGQDRTWARRSLALALIEQGSYQELQRAKRLVEQNLADSGPLLADRRAMALVLAAYPTRQPQRQAVQAWEAILQEQQTLTPEDHFILALLYWRLGDEAHAARQLRTVLARQGNEPRYAAAYIRFLLQRRETSEAELWLQRLTQLAPETFTTVSLQSQADIQRLRVDAAIDRLHRYLDAPHAQPKERATRLALVAPQLESLAEQARKADNRPSAGQADREAAAKRLIQEAETAYRQQAGPGAALRMAAFLGRHGRFAETLDCIEREGPAAAPPLLAEAISTVVGNHAAPEHLQRIDGILQAAAKKHDRPPVLLSLIATVYTSQRRFDEAEAIYREILQDNGGDVAAVNNLAMLLALRGRQLDEAEQLTQRALAAGGPLAAILDTSAVVLLAQGRPQEALAQLDQALAEGREAIYCFHRAQAQLAAGDPSAASRSMAEAKKLGLRPEQLHPLERPAFQSLVATSP